MYVHIYCVALHMSILIRACPYANVCEHEYECIHVEMCVCMNVCTCSGPCLCVHGGTECACALQV